MKKLEIDMNILDPDVYKTIYSLYLLEMVVINHMKMDVQLLFTAKNQNA